VTVTQDAPNPLDVRNAGEPWTEAEELRFRNLGQANTPMRLIVRELGRPEDELRVKAEELGVNLDTGNYNRLGLHERGR
jgi:hypothetical protein